MMTYVIKRIAFLYSFLCLLGGLVMLVAISREYDSTEFLSGFAIFCFSVLVFFCIGNFLMWKYIRSNKKKKALFSAILPILFAGVLYLFIASGMYHGNF